MTIIFWLSSSLTLFRLFFDSSNSSFNTFCLFFRSVNCFSISALNSATMSLDFVISFWEQASILFSNLFSICLMDALYFLNVFFKFWWSFDWLSKLIIESDRSLFVNVSLLSAYFKLLKYMNFNCTNNLIWYIS